MPNGTSALQLAQTINGLYRKANDLADESQVLEAAGPHSTDPALFQQKASAARQEAYYCSAKAHALQAGSAYTYPGTAVLQQLAKDCQILENAIATSAEWIAVIAAGDTLIKSMPANSV